MWMTRPRTASVNFTHLEQRTRPFCLAKRPSCARIAATGTKTGTIDDHDSVQIQARRDQIVDASLGPTIGGGTKNPRSTTGGVP